MTPYEGSKPYIFISYAHKDAERVLPIIEALAKSGFRVWYDAGIEVGTEWPEYIAGHLKKCAAMLAFVSHAFDVSHNCRREINYAINKQKSIITVYLEKFEMSDGMELQLGTLQSAFYYRHSGVSSFCRELSTAEMLAPCRDTQPILQPNLQPKPQPQPTPQPRPQQAPTLPKKLTLSGDSFVITNGVLKQYKGKEQDVIIPSGVIEIAAKAFQSAAIRSVTVPDGVEKIGTSAFSFCGQLLSITLPDSVTTIGKNVFSHCGSLVAVTLSKRLTEIPESAFEDCRTLITVIVPDNLMKIGNRAFFKCPQLKDFALPSALTEIGLKAFYGCKSLRKLTIPQGVTTVSDSAFCNCGSLSSLTIVSGVKTLSANAFASCTALTSLQLPSTVTSIGPYAFWGCSELRNAYIPHGARCAQMEPSFSNHTTIHRVNDTVSPPTAPTSVPVLLTMNAGGFVIENSILLRYNGTDPSLKIPHGVSLIAPEAFKGCQSLCSIVIPDGVTKIGMDAFADCTCLVSVAIPQSVTEIDVGAFQNCASLMQVSLPATAAYSRILFPSFPKHTKLIFT